jgi:hypothetical protein
LPELGLALMLPHMSSQFALANEGVAGGTPLGSMVVLHVAVKPALFDFSAADAAKRLRLRNVVNTNAGKD